MNVGITGHQELGNKDCILWLKSEIVKEITYTKYKRGYTCLAKGADQLFADIVLKNKIDLVSIIPCEEYEKTFSDFKSLNDFKFFLNKSSKIIKMPFEMPTEAAFFNASKYLITKIDLLIAIWDGKNAKGLGGTADVVQQAKDQNVRILHLNTINKTSKYI